MYTFKFETTENNIKAILSTDYESFTLGSFSNMVYSKGDSVLSGYVNGINKDKTVNRDNYKSYKGLKAWYNQVSKMYFDKLDMKCFYTFEAVQTMFNNSIVKPESKEESYTVGNRSFKEESHAMKYCDTCDFDYNMIIRA